MNMISDEPRMDKHAEGRPDHARIFHWTFEKEIRVSPSSAGDAILELKIDWVQARFVWLTVSLWTLVFYFQVGARNTTQSTTGQ